MARPPEWPTRLLSRFLDPADRESVLAELEELFEIQCARRGEKWAARWYRRHALVFVAHLIRHGAQRGTREGRSAFQRAMDERDGRGGVGMNEFMMEMRQAVRRLLRAPVFTGVAVATLAIGIGAFTSIFALVESVLLEEPPYEAPEQLEWVWRDYVEASFPRGWLGGNDVHHLRTQSDVFEGVVGVRSPTANLTSTDGSEAERVRLHQVTHEFLDVLGVAPLRGRGFQVGDDVVGAAPVALLNHAFWVRRFGADPGVVGRTIHLDGVPTEVVGVMPESFRFVRHGSLSEPLGADIYVPLTDDLASANPGSGAYAALVRVRPGVGEAELDAAFADAATQTNESFAQSGGSPIRLWSIGLEEDLVSGVSAGLWALGGSAAFLLMVLSANLATLLLGRASVRARELGIRAALGAGRTRVVTSALGEAVVLALVGGAAGIGLAYAGVDVIIRMAPDNLPRLGSVGMDASVVLVAVAITGAMACLAGLGPALHAARSRATAGPLEDDGRSSGTPRSVRARGALVSAQLALSLMLLVGGGMTARAFAALIQEDPGFEPGETLTFRVPLPGNLYEEAAASGAFHAAFRDRLSALPGVDVVGATTALPLTQVTNQRPISFPGAPGNTGDDQLDVPQIDWFRTTPGYFQAVGQRVLAGRAFDRQDSDTTSLNIIIDDVLANRFFPDGNAIGSPAAIFGLEAIVVGVVDQARLYSVHSDDRGQVYIPFERFPVAGLSYAVRTSGDATVLGPVVRSILREMDSTVPLTQVRTLESIVDDSLGRQRLSLALISVFALGALLLATLGLYGVVANGVTRRRQEIGVRMALGADPNQVVRMILTQGLRLSAVGAALGLVGALLAAGFLENVVFGVDARDPVVYAGVAVLLLLVAVAASWVPALRATRIAPLEALRPQ